METLSTPEYINEVPTDLIDNLIQQAEHDGIQKILGGAHIIKNGELLLLIRADGEFMEGLVELPSGTIDQGETLIEGLVREIKEETGLDVKKIKRYVDSFDYLSGSGKKTRQFNFIIETNNGEVILNPEEHKAHLYIDPNLSEKLEELGVSELVRISIQRTL